MDSDMDPCCKEHPSHLSKLTIIDVLFIAKVFIPMIMYSLGYGMYTYKEWEFNVQ